MINFDYLMGATEEGNVITAEVKLNDKNNFSICFNNYYPVVLNDSFREERARNFVEGMEDCGEAYNYCKHYDCKPSELYEYILYNYDDEITYTDINSDYDLYYHDEEYGLEFVACGQCGEDFNEVVKHTNFGFSFMIYLLWEQYHLKTIENKDELNNIIAMLSMIKEDCYADYENQRLWLIKHIREKYE